MTVVEQAAASSARRDKYYRPELDWLRFLAFSLVFLFHALPLESDVYMDFGVNEHITSFLIIPLIRAGGHGVELFFVLSAYLISELLMRERERTGAVHVKSFYVRRILRIWPLYFFFALVVYPFDAALTGQHSSYYIALLFFVSNWHNVFVSPVLAPSAHLWTVSIEEQFYVVWPHVVRKATMRLFVAIMISMILIAVGWRTIYILSGIPDQFVVRSNTFMRIDMFALGGLLACYFHHRPAQVSKRARMTLLATALALYWAIGLDLSGGYEGSAPLWAYPFAGLASMACLAAFIGGPIRLQLAWPQRLMSYLGKISYGLYLWHNPAIWITHQIVPDDNTPDLHSLSVRLVFSATLTLIVSVVSYEVLEKPFLRMKRRFTFVESRPE